MNLDTDGRGPKKIDTILADFRLFQKSPTLSLSLISQLYFSIYTLDLRTHQTKHTQCLDGRPYLPFKLEPAKTFDCK